MLSCIVICALLFYRFTVNIEATLMVAANISNATGEYYYLQNDGINDKEVICSNVEACFVECVEESSCLNARIDATASNSFTFIDCAYNGCDGTVVYGPKLEANINPGWYKGVEFQLNTTKIINYNGGGYPISLYATEAEEVYLSCDSCSSITTGSSFYLENVSKIIEIYVPKTGGLGGAFIYAPNANKLEIMCMDGTLGCMDVVVWPPHKEEYAFTIYCTSIRESCQSITVHVPSNEYINNYMQLICSRQWSHSDNVNYDYDWDDICNVNWQCHDIDGNTSISSTIYQQVLGGYGCDTNDCCPWKEANDMVLNATKFYRKEVDQSITPLSNKYTLDKDPDFANYPDYSKITCIEGTDCTVICSRTLSCRGYTIYAGLADNLRVVCSYKSSCTGMYIAEGPKKSAEIICQTAFDIWEPCSEAVFDLSGTENVYLLCNNSFIDDGTSDQWKGACYDSALIADGATTATVVCDGSKYNCYDASFYLTNVIEEATVIPAGPLSPLRNTLIVGIGSNRLSINCSFDTACDSLDVYPPYHKEYAFLMWCPLDGTEGGCSGVSIRIENSTKYVTNYMALVCNNDGGYTPNLDASVCRIAFHCEDITTNPDSSTTRINWDSNGEYWFCVNSGGQWGYVGTEYNGLCCPWIEQSYMIEHTVEPTLQPTVNTASPSIKPTKMPTSPTTTTTATPTTPTTTISTYTSDTEPGGIGRSDANKLMVVFLLIFMSITVIM